MMISTKGRYALRIMIDLAQNLGKGYISLKLISERQEISLKYLEAIIGILNRANFVSSMRGKSGGYKLSRNPSEYSVGSILRLTEGGIVPVNCTNCKSDVVCRRGVECLSYPLWNDLDVMVNSFLEGITLQDLLDGKLDNKEIKISLE
jgi:Rrf2 family protein